MLPHEQRVVTEKQELDEKLTKLKAFTSTDIFSKLSEAEQERLHRQMGHMDGYSGVLQERIDNF